MGLAARSPAEAAHAARHGEHTVGTHSHPAPAPSARGHPHLPSPRRLLSGRLRRWLPWLLGAALLSGVVLVALNVSEAAELARLVEAADPGWLVVAALLQLGTYVAEGSGWWVVARAGGTRVPLRTTTKLAVTKLFVDQALPSAGLSGTLVFATSLEQRGLSRALVMAAVVVDIATYYAAYTLALAAAVTIGIAQGQIGTLVVVVAAVFVVFGVALAVGILVLSGRRAGTLGRRLERVKPLRIVLEAVMDADARVAHSPRVLAAATGCQLGVFVLDAATLWTGLLALGVVAPPGAVFAAFMLSNLLRTVGVVPGGLGTFEGMAVLTLHAAGLSVPLALSGTLLFRGLSFWLPLLPGMWLARRAAASLSAGPPSSARAPSRSSAPAR